MIPFAPSLFLPLLMLVGYLLGIPALLWLMVKLLKLAFSQKARADFMRHRKKHFIHLGLLCLPVLTLANTLQMEQKIAEIRAEIEQEERERTPTLAQETTLAGITMPAGTQLSLLRKNTVGASAVKPEYFETAEFPKPVRWNGLSIRSMNRALHTIPCINKHLTDDISCEDLPAKEQETEVNWDWYVYVELAEPTTLNGFYCQGQVSLKSPELKQISNGENPPKVAIDASLPAPPYEFTSCEAGNGNIIKSQNGYFDFELPKGSKIYESRVLDRRTEKGYYDTWNASQYGGRDDDILTTNLFTLIAEPYLGMDYDTHHLLNLSGVIVKGTPECPLEKDSYVAWTSEQADTLEVWSKNPIHQCGQFKLKILPTMPEQMQWMRLEADENGQP